MIAIGLKHRPQRQTCVPLWQVDPERPRRRPTLSYVTMFRVAAAGDVTSILSLIVWTQRDALLFPCVKIAKRRDVASLS